MPVFSIAVLILIINVHGFSSVLYFPAKSLSASVLLSSLRTSNDIHDNHPPASESITQKNHKYQQKSNSRHATDRINSNNVQVLSTCTRGCFIKQTAISIIAVIAAGTDIHRQPQSVYAATTTEILSKEEQEALSTKRIAAFDAVRKELTTNGIPYMKQLIQEEKYDELLEFTKTYDQILRKQKMGSAKKLIAVNIGTDNENDLKNIKDRATQYSNNVTFDLIGINRSIRPNATNQQENAMKYLQELQTDIEQFLLLE
jgi:hypothetical protein